MREINHQKLEAHARRLELQVATTRLLTHLFPGSEGIGATPGRYQFLEKAIEQRPRFLQALLDGKRESVQSEWPQVLANHQSDASFLHGLAVLYREQALASLERGQPNEHHWIIGTTLWCSLLCADEFWEYFSQARVTDRDSGERLPLEPEQQDNLFYETLQSIFSLHSTFGRRDFAQGRYEQAHVHLRCLDICRNGGEGLIVALDEYGLPYELNPDDGRLKQVIDMANNLLDDWGAALVREAEKVTEDAEAIKNIPQGIRKNYEGGIGHLEPFIKLNIPVIRVLRTSLKWYNDWCYDLYVTRDIARIKELMQPARLVADQLAPLCIKGRGHTPENQALSQHFLLRGFTADEPEHSVKEYEEALAWNPGNDNAEKLLGDAAQEVLMKQIQTAIECTERKQFREAYEVLDSIEKQATDKERVQEARAVVCFRHANALANDGKFREALRRGRKALQLEPEQPVIQDFVKEMEELAPEEDNLRHLHRAQEEFEKERYDRAIQAASQVSPKSKFLSNARRLQSAAYFHRGIAVAKEEPPRFAQAASDLELALALNDSEEERKIIAKQLDIIQQNKIFQEVKRAMDNQNWSEAEQLLRKALADQISPKLKREIESQLAVVYFRRGIAAANDNPPRFTQAASDLERALALNKNEEERKIIARQLEIVQQNKIGYEVKQALDNQNWSKGEQLLRKALAGQISPNLKREIESQLSYVLNAHAVSLVNEVQEIEKSFGEALQFIMTSAKAMQTGELWIDRDLFGYGRSLRSSDCAVCGSESAKFQVAQKILLIASRTGSFSVGGLEQFWRNFKEVLCYSCQSKLDSILAKKREALKLLEEAVRLDSNNDAARRNRESLRNII